jgi:hypothetical protein
MVIDKMLFYLTEKRKEWFSPWVSATLRCIKVSLDTICIPFAACLDIKNFSDEWIWRQLDNKSIALVWNAPNLEKTCYGNDIDNHDRVIRMNTWIISNKLEWNTTWTKVDLWATWALNAMMHPEVGYEVVKNKEKYCNIILWLSDSPKQKGSQFSKIYLQKIKFRWHKLYYTPDLFYKHLVRKVSSKGSVRIPSTWFTTFHFLYKYISFQKLSLYWFTFDSSHRVVKSCDRAVHNFDREKEIIENIVWKESNIDIYT